MTPFWTDDHLTLYGGDCRAVLAELPAESVHCVVTSPPYWGLRDYGVSDQLGLEPTPEAYVANMVAVFREVRRVLRADGTLWLNLGDSYANDGKWGGSTGGKHVTALHGGGADGATGPGRGKRETGLKPKDLVGIPWRVAFALQADGWYLRSDIIWSKPNPMPESVTDRPTKAHEYLFLLSKSPRYYFDADAVREGRTDSNGSRSDAIQRLGTTDGIPTDAAKLPDSPYHAHKGARRGLPGVGTTFVADPAGRNLRSVWTIATEPYPGAHFATFPRKLVEPCVKAGTSERGVCPECGAPWVREVEVERLSPSGIGTQHKNAHHPRVGHTLGANGPTSEATTTGWRPSCECYELVCEIEPTDRTYAEPLKPVHAVVLDPFAGSGTTLLVAQALGRKGIGVDLNPEYLRQALSRNAQTPLGLVG